MNDLDLKRLDFDLDIAERIPKREQEKLRAMKAEADAIEKREGSEFGPDISEDAVALGLVEEVE